jgi:phage-related protein
MQKKIFFDKNSERELKRFSRPVQQTFLAYMQVLSELGRLEPPDAKKLTQDLFEIRVRKQGSYRGFYAYIQNDYIVILHFFHKKTQKTPINHIKIAQSRLQKYD